MTRDEILAPYAEMLEAERDANERMLEMNRLLGRKLSRYQQKRLDAVLSIEEWLEELVVYDGDITRCGEIPRIQWNSDNGMISGMLGKDVRPRIVVRLPDGRPFRAGPKSPFVSDPHHILQGGRDPSGALYQPYNRVLRNGVLQTFPCWNLMELTDEYKPTGGDDDLDLLRSFDTSLGTLRSDPNTWQEPFRSVFLEWHPNYVFTGTAQREPWVRG